MLQGWNHFSRIPEVVSADSVFWGRFVYRNLDKVVKILAYIPQESKCLVCNEFSMNFTSRSTLARHIQGHKAKTIEFWLNNMISKTPEELEFMLYDGAKDGVVDY